jgi:membrane-bound lytic murein transglycosylase B
VYANVQNGKVNIMKHISIDYIMSEGDYLDYTKALETFEYCKVVARRNSKQAKAMRHKASEAVARLEARYEVQS